MGLTLSSVKVEILPAGAGALALLKGVFTEVTVKLLAEESFKKSTPCTVFIRNDVPATLFNCDVGGAKVLVYKAAPFTTRMFEREPLPFAPAP